MREKVAEIIIKGCRSATQDTTKCIVKALEESPENLMVRLKVTRDKRGFVIKEKLKVYREEIYHDSGTNQRKRQDY